MLSGIRVIQGGMGVGVSGWPLARAVALRGQMGVVSGTGVGVTLVRRLQQGDPGGHMARGLAAFPLKEVATRVWERYYVAGGIGEGVPYKLSGMPRRENGRALEELLVAANFVEVYLAKEGHQGMVGVNYLEKLQAPMLPSLYGAILAGVDCVLMGAGIPRLIPGALDKLAAQEPAELRIDLDEGEGDAPGEAWITSRFDPQAFCGTALPPMKRPAFLAIVASATLAMTLARKSNGRVDGFVIEGPTAGGHNAPPRGQAQLNELGEPIYGERDVVDLPKIRALGLPFWLAGGYGTPEQLKAALQAGAAGIQVGTAFAFCQESSLRDEIKAKVISAGLDGGCTVRTDARASPTGFPFKVVQLGGTLSDAETYAERARICDLGYLRRAYKRDDGMIGYRCPAEPVEDYVAKGGDVADTVGRKCLCNALFAAIGLGQTDAQGVAELPLITAGDEVRLVSRYLKPGTRSYTAADVLAYLQA